MQNPGLIRRALFEGNTKILTCIVVVKPSVILIKFT